MTTPTTPQAEAAFQHLMTKGDEILAQQWAQFLRLEPEFEAFTGTPAQMFADFKKALLDGEPPAWIERLIHRKKGAAVVAVEFLNMMMRAHMLRALAIKVHTEKAAARH